MATDTVPVEVLDALSWLDDLRKSVYGLSEAIQVANRGSNTSIAGLAHAGCLVAADIEAQLDIITRALRGERLEALDDAALLRFVRKGLPQIVALQRQVRQLPPFRLPDTPEDDALVHDRLGATRVVLCAIDEIPRPALAAAIADVMLLNEDVEKLGKKWVGHLTRELEEIATAGASA